MFRMPTLSSLHKRSSWMALAAALTFGSSSSAQDSTSWHPVDAQLEVGASTDYDGVQIFPIRSTTTRDVKEDVVTLKEALNQGTVTVVEQGEGEVSQLTVVNNGQKPVLLAVGDVVEGGRQDRVIVSDLIVPPNKRPTPVAVHCVEQGRWTQGAQRIAFNYGGRGESALKKVLQMDSNQQATWGAVASLNGTKGSQIQRLAALSEAGETSAQGMYGNAQSSSLALSELQPATGTYMASMTSSAIETHLTAYTEAMEPLLDERQVVGIVIALDGQLVAAEAYGDPRVFHSSARDILRSVGLDALSREIRPTSASPVSTQQAAEFLQVALNQEASSRTSHPTGTQIRKRGTGSSSFELHDSNGGLLHLNVYAH
jgi:hypothetical protein